MEIRYLGHSCFTLKTQGKTLLFDPFISGNDLAKGIQLAFTAFEKLGSNLTLMKIGEQLAV
jgi:L-ascorbate metabolism protein UlaG (beta-lactamase superfamily)